MAQLSNAYKFLCLKENEQFINIKVKSIIQVYFTAHNIKSFKNKNYINSPFEGLNAR